MLKNNTFLLSRRRASTSINFNLMLNSLEITQFTLKIICAQHEISKYKSRDVINLRRNISEPLRGKHLI